MNKVTFQTHPFLWIPHQSTLDGHVVIHLAVNDMSENPRGTDIENKQVA